MICLGDRTSIFFVIANESVRFPLSHFNTINRLPSIFPVSLYNHPGEPLWDPGSSVAVPGWGWVLAGASGGQAADGLCCLAVLPEQQQRLLHVPHPGHRPQLWRLLRLPAPTDAGMHGILCTGYVRGEASIFEMIITKKRQTAKV